jgi:hypothetical protein
LSAWHTGGGNFGNITFASTTYNISNAAPAFAIGGSNSPTWTTTGDTSIGIKGYASPGAGQTVTVSNARIKTTAITQTNVATISGSGTTFNFTNSSACLSSVNQGMIRHTDGGSATVNITGSMLYVTSASGAGSAIIDTGNLAMTMNSTVLDGGVTGIWQILSVGTGETYVGDNNTFASPAVSKWTLNNSANQTTLAAWRTLSGQDANSTTAGSGASACN